MANQKVKSDIPLCFNRYEVESIYECLRLRDDFAEKFEEISVNKPKDVSFWQTDIGEVALVFLGAAAGYGIAKISTK